MEVNVGDMFVANCYFFKVCEVYSNYVMVERLGANVISSDFDIENYRQKLLDKDNFSKIGSRYFWSFNDSTYPLTLELAPSDDVLDKFKMMIDKRTGMLKSGQKNIYLNRKYNGPIIYKTAMTNDYKLLPEDTIEQIKQIKKECNEMADNFDS